MSQPSAFSLPANRATAAAAFFCACIILGLFTFDSFRILSSIGIAGLSITSWIHLAIHRRIEQWKQWRLFLPLVVVFVIHLLAGFNTSVANQELYWQDIILQIPFLLLPLAFWILPPLPSQRLRQLYGFFYVAVVLSAAVSTGYYLLHAAEINESYFRSKVMPTLPDHIRFSLMVVLAIIVGVLFEVHKVVVSWVHWLLRLSIGFLIVYLFMLAVRSGLAIFFALGVVAIGWKAREKKYRTAISIVLLLIILPLLSFYLLPTFRNKFHNTRDDAGRIEQTKSANNYSLVGRVYSYKVAAIMIQKYPWVGIGKADMSDELAKQYHTNFPAIRPQAYLAPHNQFLYYLVAFGVVGCMMFVVAFYYPGIQVWGKRAPLLFAQYIIVTLSFLVEYTLETQIGVLFSLFFLLLPLNGALVGANEKGEWRPT